MNGQKLKEAREAKGYSQAELGELCGGVSRSSICRFENGSREPSLALLRVIAEVLGVRVEALL